MEEVVYEARLSVIGLIVKLIIDCFLILFCFYGLYLIVKDLITYFSTKLTITNKKLTGKTGFIHKEELDSPLNKISGVKISQGLFGQILNYGNVCITTASSTFIFYQIQDPSRFKNVLNSQIEAYEEGKIDRQAKKMADALK